MTAAFIGCSFGVIASNYIYQFFCSHPDWSAATERSWFQLVALIAVGLSLSLTSIKP